MAKDRLSGKFAFILHADVAGSTSIATSTGIAAGNAGLAKLGLVCIASGFHTDERYPPG